MNRVGVDDIAALIDRAIIAILDYLVIPSVNTLAW